MFVLLPDESIVKGDLEWYFFCPIEKKYSSGDRRNRSTDVGQWKVTGDPRDVKHNNALVGSIKTLIFYERKGKAQGKRTNWVMHEYRLDDNYRAERGVAQVMFGNLSFFSMIVVSVGVVFV